MGVAVNKSPSGFKSHAKTGDKRLVYRCHRIYDSNEFIGKEF